MYFDKILKLIVTVTGKTFDKVLIIYVGGVKPKNAVCG